MGKSKRESAFERIKRIRKEIGEAHKDRMDEPESIGILDALIPRYLRQLKTGQQAEECPHDCSGLIGEESEVEE